MTDALGPGSRNYRPGSQTALHANKLATRPTIQAYKASWHAHKLAGVQAYETVFWSYALADKQIQADKTVKIGG